MQKLLPLLLLLCCAYFNKVSAQVQLTDFTFREGDENSDPNGFIEFNGLFLFTASTTTEGRELWVSDGTAANTRLLKDINPGSSDGVLSFSPAVLGDQLFFIANDGEYGPQLWATKGTAQSTRRITSIPGLSSYTGLSPVGDQIFFTITNNRKLAVWKSDGTQEGTQVVKEDFPLWSSPSFEGSANQLFFFTIPSEGSSNSRVWRSDGSEAGTFPVTEEIDGNGAGSSGTSNLTQYIVFKDELYFVARSYNRFPYNENMGIMKTDGTLEGTQAVKGLHDASTSLIDVADVIEVNNKLYFSFFQVSNNHLFIWETDGSTSGSRIIYDEYAPAYFMPSNLSSDGSRLVFTGPGTDNTTALLTLSTDTYEITEIKQLIPTMDKPSYRSFSNIITRLSEKLYHIVLQHTFPQEIWISDLSPTNTVLSGMKRATSSSSLFYKENFYFSGHSEHEGQELWRADPTFSSHELFMNINQSGLGLSTYSSFAALDDQILLRAGDEQLGAELWTYQTPTDELSMVIDILEGEESSFPINFLPFKDHIYFEAYTEKGATALFRTDGTAEGTLNVSDVIEKPDYGTSITQIAPAKEQVYFVTRLKNSHYGLCATDGTDSWVIKDLGVNEYGAPYNVSKMVAVENQVFFVTGGSGEDLWVSDGTEGGTFKLKGFGRLRQLAAGNGKVYLVASENYYGAPELWQSDGTASGTSRVVNNSGEAFSQPDNLSAFNDHLVFSASTATHGRELWKTDGTAAGTAMIRDIRSGIASAISTTEYAIMEGFLYFSANDGINGRELWKTDGTAAGTAMVKDIYPGEGGAQLKNLFSAGDLLYFSAYTPESGYELWLTEGTAASSRQVYDLIEGQQGSEPSNFMLLGNELYFTAETSHSGRQLWHATEKEITAVTTISKSGMLKVYPNPTTDHLFIDSESQPIKSLQLFHLNGQMVSLPGQPGNSLHVAHLPAGLYFVRIETDKKLYVKKFIKK